MGGNMGKQAKPAPKYNVGFADFTHAVPITAVARPQSLPPCTVWPLYPAMLTLSDFDFPLPPELIAQSALPDRSASRLLVVERTAPRTPPTRCGWSTAPSATSSNT
jgi:hypothetical protein